MGHTPGPWRAVDTPSVGWEIKAEVKGYRGTPTIWHGHGGGGDRSATLAYEPWVQFPPKELQEMFAANARLIAASPELLEALKKTWCAAISDDHAIGDGSAAASTCTVCADARAAIAKAEGRGR
jgi:hypothetical protein